MICQPKIYVHDECYCTFLHILISPSFIGSCWNTWGSFVKHLCLCSSPNFTFNLKLETAFKSRKELKGKLTLNLNVSIKKEKEVREANLNANLGMISNSCVMRQLSCVLVYLFIDFLKYTHSQSALLAWSQQHFSLHVCSIFSYFNPMDGNNSLDNILETESLFKSEIPQNISK